MLVKFKQNWSTILLVFILLIGLSLLVYPTISDYWNSLHQSRAVAGYIKTIDNRTAEENTKILENARAYNQTLSQNITPDLNLNNSETETYNNMLRLSGTDVMAYIEIPKLNTTMPIYHGIDDAVLQIAIGHIAGTSLPIGGKGTHAVISGHRGLPSAKLFSDINQLVEGDTFIIQVLDKTLTYEVDKILTVTPDDVSALAIDPNQDYVTLVTCTPYGVNTHRLLVRGHRIENSKNFVRVTSEVTQITPVFVAVVIAVILLCILLLALRTSRKLFL